MAVLCTVLLLCLAAVGAGVARAGVRRLVWVNGHGGNRAAMDVAALALRRRFGMLVVKCTYTRLGLPDGADEHDDVARGFHGGWLETALMRRLAPDRVRTDALDDFPARHIDDRPDALVSPEGPAPFAWLALGSQGRREQTLLTDQDTALVFGDVDDDGD